MKIFSFKRLLGMAAIYGAVRYVRANGGAKAVFDDLSAKARTMMEGAKSTTDEAKSNVSDTSFATNTGRDYFRRNRIRDRWQAPLPSADDAATATQPEAVEPGGDPAARAAAEEVKHLLARLAPDDAALLTLHHLEGWSLVDIAAQYGWTVTATKLRAWRARRQLRALYLSVTPL